MSDFLNQPLWTHFWVYHAAYAEAYPNGQPSRARLSDISARQLVVFTSSLGRAADASGKHPSRQKGPMVEFGGLCALSVSPTRAADPRWGKVVDGR